MADRQAATTGLEGTVERVTFHNPENGFSVIRLRTRGRREPVAVVGTLPAVQPGERLVLTGEWTTDPRHGAQYRVATATVAPPSGRDAIARYLGSGLIRQLGPTLAGRIADHFGDQTLEVLDSQPGRVREVPGIGPGRAQSLADAWIEHRALRAVAAFLAEHGLDGRFAPRLVAAYGADAPKTLAANPYRLVAEVPGLGFAAADRLGRDLGVRATAPARLQAAVHATLLRAAQDGHTRAERESLVADAAEIAGVEPALVAAAVTQLLAGGVIATTVGEGEIAVPAATLDALPLFVDRAPSPVPVATPVPAVSGRLRIYDPIEGGGRRTEGRGDENRQDAEARQDRQGEQRPSTPVPSSALRPPPSAIGLRGLVRAEEWLAARLRVLAERPGRTSPGAVEAWLARDEGAAVLSEEQRAAVRAAATSGCFVLTGGPGVGKTTTVRTLVRCLRALGRSVALAAPTGKAAKRLGEVVAGGEEGGIEAKTIHRLLGAGPKGFRHGPREPLPHDVVIVDEASMLDTQLARACVSAIGPRGQLILVGDADQLPSVGPGQVLRDLLASGTVPSTELRTVFRQAARSQIIRAAHRIRQGAAPELAPPSTFDEAAGVDCLFVPAPAGRIAEIAAGWAAERLPRLAGLAPGEIQTLAPLTRSCQSLNALLQERLNPQRGQDERPHGALALRVGDRVIQTRNNYNLGVFNGDGGTIGAITDGEVAVDFGDGRAVVYAPADLLDLDHAYALTVHRAQGSEWPGVIVLVSSSHGPMLSRNLLYTALTRARRVAVLIGDEAAIARAVAERGDGARRTGLAALLTA